MRTDRPAVRVGLVLAVAVLICLRLPNVVLHGRMWAEEGKDFYARAASLPWSQALWLPFGGYLNLIANAAPILARHLVALEYVPWITSGIGLVFQCVPAIILVCSRDAWLQRPLVLLACLLLVATPPVTEEVWLQTLHSQFHLALGCALILALDPPAGPLRLFGYAVLLLAPLCGPAAAALAPMFFLRAAIDRSGERLVQGSILLLAAGLQALLFFAQAPGRSHEIGIPTLIGIFYIKQIIVPLLGRVTALPIAERLKAMIAAGAFPLRAAVISTLALALFAVMLVRTRLAAAAWMVAAALLMLGAAIYGSLSDGPGLMTIAEAGRYTFLPQVLLALALAAIAGGFASQHRWEVWLARALVVWLIAAGARDVARQGLYMANGPNWRDEVARWRQDPAHPIAIWPPGWTMSLSHE